MDDSYCASCSRYILPKRHQVPVYAAPASIPDQQPPSVPPPSPTSASLEKALVKTRSKQGTIRARGGLARGTGRVKANSTVTLATATKKPAEPAAQPTPVKHRTVIDQGPTPLYCSDGCRLADLEERHAVISADSNPLCDIRASLAPPAVSHNSLAGYSEESLSSSSEVSPSPKARDGVHVLDYISWESVSPSVAALAKMYDWSSLPVRPAAVAQQEQEDAEEAAEVTCSLEETYTSGVMMAAERIKDALITPQSSSKLQLRHSTPAHSRARALVPGWTDGTDAWRASVYSMSPKDMEIRGMKKPEERPRAYGSFAASPHRSTGGVYSTVSSDQLQSPIVGNLPVRANTTSDVAQYPLYFARRTDRRMSLPRGSQSLPTSTRSRSLVKKGAEGQLLVPDVTLTARSPTSVASTCSSSLVRSPLSRYGSDLSVSVVNEEEHEQQSATSKGTPTKRPTVDTRSWSYDHMLTYEVMPMKAEPSPRKSLFLFPGKPSASFTSAANPLLSAPI